MNQTSVTSLLAHARLLRLALATLALLTLTRFPLAAAEETPDANDAYHRALATGKAKLEAGQLAEARRDFQAAVQADSVAYEAYFYLAVASFRLGDHAAALEYANAAVNAAADDERPRARELLKAISNARETEELARQADEAHAKGLIAKAADLYATAFQLSPDRGDLGLKAATLLGQRLNRLLEAAVLLQGVVASGDATAATAAGSELGALHDRLTALYQDELPRAVSRDDRTTLWRLARAFPQEAQPHLELAASDAADGDGEATVRELGEAVRLGTGYDAIQERVVFLDLWEKDAPAFKSFIGDAFGPPAVTDMNRRLKERQAKQAEEKRIAAEKIATAERARLEALRQKQLAKEKADRENESRRLRAPLRRPVVAQIHALLQTKPAKPIWEERKLPSYYNDVNYVHTPSVSLQGDDYVIVAKIREEGFGRKNRHGIRERISSNTIGSMARLTLPSIEPHWSHEHPKAMSGSYKQLRNLKLTFGGHVVSNLTQSFKNAELEESSGPGTVDTLSVEFLLGKPEDETRIVALFQELKAIDSLTLEQLRERTGTKP